VRLICLILALLIATPSLAQDRTLDDIATESREAKSEDARLRAERTRVESLVTDLKSQMSTVSREADTLEAQAAALTIRVSDLAAQSIDLTTQVTRDRDSIARLIATLQRIEANPPPAIAAGDTAISAARAASLSATLAARLKSRTDQLAEDLAELDSVRRQLDTERARLTLRLDTLSARRADLRELSREKAALLRSLDDAQAVQARRIAALASEADTLRELLARLEAQSKAEPRVKPVPSRLGPLGVIPRLKPGMSGGPVALRPLPEGLRFADARGQIGLPVRGRLTSRYGGDRRGLTVRSASAAQVTSPYGGRIEFAGPFKNYERLVILNAGDGYFLVLTGLGETFVSSGESITLGEPLGQMPRSSDPELYIEFRKDGRPINPTPWLRPTGA